MKRRLTLASLLFSKKSREIAAARAKASSLWWRDNQLLPCARQRLFSHGVGLKFLTTNVTHRDLAKIEFSTAKTSVWWDFENCNVSKGNDGHAVAENIRSVLLKRNYCGSLTIYAYGDTNQMASSVQQALSSTGVSLIHVPPGVKDGSDKKILVDMLLWAMENRAPANIMLISGDRDFSCLLHKLGMKRYNILLVRPENAVSPFLIAAAKTVLPWASIVTSGSGSEVPKQAEPRMLINSDLVVENKSSPRFCQAALVTSQSSHAKPKSMYCNICQVHVPESGNEEHKSGRKHKNKLKAQAAHSC